MNSPESNHEIHDSHFVLRYCGRSRWESDRNGVPRIKRKAFPDSNSSLSLNWLEFYELSELDSLVRICECHTHCNITKNGKFMKLQVRDIRLTGEQTRAGFSVKHTPHRTNRSHASVKPSDKQAAHALYLCARQYGSFLDVPDFRKIPIRERRHCSDNSVEND